MSGRSEERVNEYFVWAKKVVDGCRGTLPKIEAELDKLFQQHIHLPKIISMEQLKPAFEAAGQAHVFNYWDQLDTKQKDNLLAQLKQIDPARINRLFTQATKEKIGMCCCLPFH
jgi:hypothetical protein